MTEGLDRPDTLLTLVTISVITIIPSGGCATIGPGNYNDIGPGNYNDSHRTWQLQRQP